MAKSRKKGGGDKKHGRNAIWCQAYRSRGQRERNQVKKVLRHIKRYGATDHMAVHFFNNMPHRLIMGYPSITPEKSKRKAKE